MCYGDIDYGRDGHYRRLMEREAQKEQERRDYDRYIEVKGYERDRDKSKWKVVKDLIVLKKNEITKIKKGIFVLELS